MDAPGGLLGAALDLRPGQDIAPTDLAELLVDAGFTREDPADEHGEFALRGGILDIFPAGEALPVRLEFVGDTIESLRTYDPGTQRSIAPIDRATVVPLTDTLARPSSHDLDRSATIFDYLSRARASRAIVSERDEVEANARKLVEQVGRSYESMVAASATVPPPRELFTDLETVEARVAQATSLSQLGLEETPDPGQQS